jgi:hypothetical protein
MKMRTATRAKRSTSGAQVPFGRAAIEAVGLGALVVGATTVGAVAISALAIRGQEGWEFLSLMHEAGVAASHPAPRRKST